MTIQDRSQGRKGTPVRVLAIHTTEGYGTATDLRDASWWEGSSHAIADEGTLLSGAKDGCVDYDRAAWTLRSGNNWSDNIELIGWAKWTRDEWLTLHAGLLDNCARWLAERSIARGIPLVKLTAYEYASGGTGVIGHVDHTIGYRDGTHTDPGTEFPFDVVISKARLLTAPPQEDELTPDQAKKLDEIYALLCGATPSLMNDKITRNLREHVRSADRYAQMALQKAAEVDLELSAVKAELSALRAAKK